MSVKLLLDTDIGGDLDDALALAYLLKQPRCELLGVTTVGGQAERRAALASAVRHALGSAAMSVHVGASAPLLIPERQPCAYQAEALSARWPHQSFGKCNTAVEFLQRTIRAHPHEVTLLTIGPLTNIGLLFALDPEIPTLLAGMMVMGGSLLAEERDQEWNLVCDPHAAAIVMAAPVALTSVGWDVTRHCRLDEAEFRRRLAQAGPPLGFVGAMAEVFFRHEAPEVYFHDPLAAALLFESALCHTRAQPLAVELYDAQRLGRTRAVEGPARHRVADSVDVEAFFTHYWDVLGG